MHEIARTYIAFGSERFYTKLKEILENQYLGLGVGDRRRGAEVEALGSSDSAGDCEGPDGPEALVNPGYLFLLSSSSSSCCIILVLLPNSN